MYNEQQGRGRTGVIAAGKQKGMYVNLQELVVINGQRQRDARMDVLPGAEIHTKMRRCREVVRHARHPERRCGAHGCVITRHDPDGQRGQFDERSGRMCADALQAAAAQQTCVGIACWWSRKILYVRQVAAISGYHWRRRSNCQNGKGEFQKDERHVQNERFVGGYAICMRRRCRRTHVSNLFCAAFEQAQYIHQRPSGHKTFVGMSWEDALQADWPKKNDMTDIQCIQSASTTEDGRTTWDFTHRWKTPVVCTAAERRDRCTLQLPALMGPCTDTTVRHNVSSTKYDGSLRLDVGCTTTTWWDINDNIDVKFIGKALGGKYLRYDAIDIYRCPKPLLCGDFIVGDEYTVDSCAPSESELGSRSLLAIFPPDHHMNRIHNQTVTMDKHHPTNNEPPGPATT